MSSYSAFPRSGRILTRAVLPAELLGRDAGVVFADHADELRHGELALAHGADLLTPS